MTIELDQAVADKDNEVIAAEANLKLVEDEISDKEKLITDFRITKDELSISVKKIEQEVRELNKAVKMGRRNVSRLKREYERLRTKQFQAGRPH